jgi:hypothetical protein
MEACRRKRRKRLLFVNKKKQKNFIDAGPWALALTTAMAQHRQKLLRRFPLSEKPALSLIDLK